MPNNDGEKKENADNTISEKYSKMEIREMQGLFIETSTPGQKLNDLGGLIKEKGPDKVIELMHKVEVSGPRGEDVKKERLAGILKSIDINKEKDQKIYESMILAENKFLKNNKSNNPPIFTDTLNKCSEEIVTKSLEKWVVSNKSIDEEAKKRMKIKVGSFYDIQSMYNETTSKLDVQVNAAIGRREGLENAKRLEDEKVIKFSASKGEESKLMDLVKDIWSKFSLKGNESVKQNVQQHKQPEKNVQADIPPDAILAGLCLNNKDLHDPVAVNDLNYLDVEVKSGALNPKWETLDIGNEEVKKRLVTIKDKEAELDTLKKEMESNRENIKRLEENQGVSDNVKEAKELKIQNLSIHIAVTTSESLLETFKKGIDENQNGIIANYVQKELDGVDKLTEEKREKMVTDINQFTSTCFGKEHPPKELRLFVDKCAVEEGKSEENKFNSKDHEVVEQNAQQQAQTKDIKMSVVKQKQTKEIEMPAIQHEQQNVQPEKEMSAKQGEQQQVQPKENVQLDIPPDAILAGLCLNNKDLHNRDLVDNLSSLDLDIKSGALNPKWETLNIGDKKTQDMLVDIQDKDKEAKTFGSLKGEMVRLNKESVKFIEANRGITDTAKMGDNVGKAQILADKSRSISKTIRARKNLSENFKKGISENQNGIIANYVQKELDGVDKLTEEKRTKMVEDIDKFTKTCLGTQYSKNALELFVDKCAAEKGKSEGNKFIDWVKNAWREFRLEGHEKEQFKKLSMAEKIRNALQQNSPSHSVSPIYSGKQNTQSKRNSR